MFCKLELAIQASRLYESLRATFPPSVDDNPNISLLVPDRLQSFCHTALFHSSAIYNTRSHPHPHQTYASPTPHHLAYFLKDTPDRRSVASSQISSSPAAPHST